MNTTTQPIVADDFCRFSPDGMTGERYRDWVRAWRVAYRYLGLRLREQALECRCFYSQNARSQRVPPEHSPRPDLELRLRQATEAGDRAQAIQRVELPPVFWPWTATAMLDARKIGKEWARAHPRVPRVVDNGVKAS